MSRSFGIPLMDFGQLSCEYLCDMYCKNIQQKLLYISNNQSKLRCELYCGFKDSLQNGILPENIGKNIILPSSIPGSERHQKLQFQNSMAIVKERGSPTYFITMTCNLKWPEIQSQLKYINGKTKQSPMERPRLIAEVFNLKLKAFLKDLTEHMLVGNCLGYVWVVEWQKRFLIYNFLVDFHTLTFYYLLIKKMYLKML